MKIEKEILEKLRRDYSGQALNKAEVEKDPFLQFGRWFDEAMKAAVIDPNAMALATADRSGRPSVRIVLLKGFDEKGFIFFTNYNSLKGKNLTENPQAEVVFYWHELARQVRIYGKVSKLTEEESALYFSGRPRGSQLAAAISPQSSIIENREFLTRKYEDIMLQTANKEVSKPLSWGGYLLKPGQFEFWQGRPNRLHDRIAYYLKAGNKWKTERLAP